MSRGGPTPLADCLEACAVVSRVRVTRGRAQDHVQVWTRGLFSGLLVFAAGDGDGVAEQLMGAGLATSTHVQNVSNYYTAAAALVAQGEDHGQSEDEDRTEGGQAAEQDD